MVCAVQGPFSAAEMQMEVKHRHAASGDLLLAVDAHVPDFWARALIEARESKRTLAEYIDLIVQDPVQVRAVGCHMVMHLHCGCVLVVGAHVLDPGRTTCRAAGLTPRRPPTSDRAWATTLFDQRSDWRTCLRLLVRMSRITTAVAAMRAHRVASRRRLLRFPGHQASQPECTPPCKRRPAAL